MNFKHLHNYSLILNDPLTIKFTKYMCIAFARFGCLLFFLFVKLGTGCPKNIGGLFNLRIESLVNP